MEGTFGGDFSHQLSQPFILCMVLNEMESEEQFCGKYIQNSHGVCAHIILFSKVFCQQILFTTYNLNNEDEVDKDNSEKNRTNSKINKNN